MTSKLVAISDLHLGQTGADGLGQYSLLSTRATPNLVARFADAVAAFAGGDPVTLLVAGDLLDLSLAYAGDAIGDFLELVQALRRSARIDELIYVIGNHDHHLWSLHCEDKRLLGPLRAGRPPEPGAQYRITPPAGERFSILPPLTSGNVTAPPTSITIAYPSYTRDLAGGTLLYVTHGHLFGGLYAELSGLLADKLAGLPHDRVAATVNHPLIELIYWHLGEIGEGLGADGLVEQIYTDLQRGRDGRLRPIIARVVDQLLPHGVLWRAIGGLERRIVVDEVMRVIGKALESPPLKSVTSADRHADVETTRAGLVAWLAAAQPLRVAATPDAIVLYGHTHVRDDYVIPDSRVHSYNLGTWLVEPNHDAPKTGFLAINGADARWVDVA